ncbi:hypothetical protein LTR10_004671 [Elasticomyces elasticus]|nr:hypothetical protein LTR10_004671 [Elasticomyces elasticus]KAK4976990.1 hypothetical protein LTR42_003036 [Elasticomyces elasticus]
MTENTDTTHTSDNPASIQPVQQRYRKHSKYPPALPKSTSTTNLASLAASESPIPTTNPEGLSERLRQAENEYEQTHEPVDPLSETSTSLNADTHGQRERSDVEERHEAGGDHRSLGPTRFGQAIAALGAEPHLHSSPRRMSMPPGSSDAYRVRGSISTSGRGRGRGSIDRGRRTSSISRSGSMGVDLAGDEANDESKSDESLALTNTKKPRHPTHSRDPNESTFDKHFAGVETKRLAKEVRIEVIRKKEDWRPRR